MVIFICDRKYATILLKLSPVLKVQETNYITVQFAAGGALLTNEEVTLQSKA